MSKKMVIMSQDMTRMIAMGDGSHTWTITRTRHNSGEEITIDCDKTWMGTYPTMTEAKSVMGAIMQVYAHEGGIFYMPKASDEEEEEPDEPDEPEEKNPWIPVEEGLPDTVRTVWVSCEQSDAVYSAWHSPISGTWYVTGTHADVYLNVIAWREIDIEPYRREADNDE